MTRLPKAGSAKTRLIPALGAEGAAELQRQMTEHVVRQARIVAATDRCTVATRITGGTPRHARRWLGVPSKGQGGGDLGARIERALAEGADRADVAAVVGADCPAVDAADMRAAMHAAAGCGAAFVPATDGGYCMLAIRRDLRERLAGLFESCAWGSEAVLDQSLECLRGIGVSPAVLEPRPDIDVPEDLAQWERVRRSWYEPPRTLAVVIAALNDADHLERLLRALSETAPEVRVFIADGGSTDGTAAVGRQAGHEVVEGHHGRGAQFNAGAAEAAKAGADALLFLHADCSPPSGLDTAVLAATSDPGVALGAFTFSTGGETPTMRLIERNTNRRARLLGMPYGDQGLFCRSVMWRALGGFPDFPVMEDYEFVRRAGRAGRVVIRPELLITSDRAWRAVGPWRWTRINMGTVARYQLGATPEELAAWRRSQSKR
jgi:uncharacterized protein